MIAPRQQIDAVEVVAPGLRDAPEIYDDRIYVWSDDRDGLGWRKWCGAPLEAVTAHLGIADGTDELWQDGRRVRAVGVAYPPWVRLSWMSFDLDGGYEIEVVRAALLGVLGGSGIAHPSGGTPGRERLWVRLERPLTVAQIARAGAAVAELAGYPLKPGALEVYPASKNGRLPLGAGALGGAAYVRGSYMPLSSRIHPVEMARHLAMLPGVDLTSLAGPADELPLRPEPPTHESGRRNGPRSRSAAARSFLSSGANIGERDACVREVALAYILEGRPSEEIVGLLSAQSDHLFGGTRGGAARMRRDIPRHVRNLRRRYDRRPPDPIGLTPREAFEWERLVRRHFAEGSVEYRWALRGTPLLELLKGAECGGWRGDLQIHHTAWREHFGPAYARLRRALGIFHGDHRYRPAALALRPGDAHSKRWRTTFPWDRRSRPRRRLGSERHVVLAARAAARRGERQGTTCGQLWLKLDDLPQDESPAVVGCVTAYTRSPSDDVAVAADLHRGRNLRGPPGPPQS